MKYGFTGTQEGMTERQQKTLILLLKDMKNHVFHHGDCVGADEQAHFIAERCGLYIWIHPPINNNKRAFCESDTILPAKEYIDRNHDIVDACDILIAAPKTLSEGLRSGTWATIRYARKNSIPCIILEP